MTTLKKDSTPTGATTEKTTGATTEVTTGATTGVTEPVKRGRGRPRKIVPEVMEVPSEVGKGDTASDLPIKRGPGRPRGSKNPSSPVGAVSDSIKIKKSTKQSPTEKFETQVVDSISSVLLNAELAKQQGVYDCIPDSEVTGTLDEVRDSYLEKQQLASLATIHSEAEEILHEASTSAEIPAKINKEQTEKMSRAHKDLMLLIKDSPDSIFIESLTKQIRNDVKTLTRFDLRNLTKFYNSYQCMRIGAMNQFGATVASGEEQSATFAYLAGNMIAMEKRIEILMDVWSRSHPVGRWLRSVYGIGPVFAASLLGYIDVTKASCAAQVWSFAGLSPTQHRVKGEQSNWNAALKSMCWLISGSLVRCGKPSPERALAKQDAWNSEHPYDQHHMSQEEYNAVVTAWNSDSNLYTRLYYSRREFEFRNNENGLYADQARELLASKDYTSEEAIASLQSGKLTPGHIDARCKRYVVKMLLAHTFEFLYEAKYHVIPIPYAIAHLDHVHIVPCPNKDLFMKLAKKTSSDW